MAIKAGRVGVDPSQVTLSGYIKGGGVSPEVLTKEEAQRIYQTILGMSEYLKTVDANSLYQKISDMVNYQAKLVSGQNIKRINGEDLLGSGNITVLTRDLADGIYQTIAGMSNYALKSEIPDMDDVVTKAEAPGYDDILTRTAAQSLYSLSEGEGIDIINNVISNVFDNKSNVDLDTLMTNYQGYVFTVTNMPSGESNNGFLIVLGRKNSTTTAFQLYVPYNADKVYTRIRLNSAWGGWQVLYNLSSLTAGTGISISNGVISNSLTGGNGITISNGVVTNYYTHLNEADLDSFSNNMFIGYAFKSTNRPANTSDFGMLIQLVGAGRKMQMYYNLYNGDLYIRRYYGSQWYDWHKYNYSIGDTVTVANAPANEVVCSGFLTSSGTTVNFQLPLDKPIEGTTVTFSSLYVVLRGGQGYLDGSSPIDVCANSAYTVTGKVTDGGIKVIIEKTSAFTGTNNTPVAVQVRGRTYRFS